MITEKEILSIIENNDINVDAKTLDTNTLLTEQGLDSLDMMVILFALEEDYQLKVPDEDLEAGKLASIDRIVKYVNDRI